MTFQRKHYWMGALFVQMTFFGWHIRPFIRQPHVQRFIQRCHPTTASPYIFVNVLKTWDEAEDYCQSMYDSHLATIEDDLSAQALLDGCSFSTQRYIQQRSIQRVIRQPHP
eukprot:916414_1